MHGSCLIVPSYVLEALGAHGGDRETRTAARRSLELTERLRNDRAPGASSSRLPAEPRRSGERRRVFSGGGTTQVPGELVRTEESSTADDPVADRAFEAVGTTYRFFREVYDRDSIDGHGQPLTTTVHYATKFDNAFWDGNEMVFGDGDGTFFADFTKCLDVVAHELTHGIVQNTCDLAYADQSGALGESIADVFGSVVKQWHAKQSVDDADWLIGVDLFLPGVNATALRSLAAPGTAYDDPALGGRDPQPAHMRRYVRTPHDDGGVHINSGIPNHAFYLAARALGGHAWETVGRVWYETLLDGLPADASFTVFATATHRVAKRHGTRTERAVLDAWRRVGIEIAW